MFGIQGDIDLSHQEVQDFFKEYVFGFMFSDIQREIDLARDYELGHRKDGGGNLLAALGLLCYTEVMGDIKAAKQGKRNFDAFFNDLGSRYASFNQTVNVYDVFRCGMAHEYLVKKNCKSVMRKGSEICGIGQMPNRRHYFVVERYFEDFSSACQRLYRQLMAQANPTFPK